MTALLFFSHISLDYCEKISYFCNPIKKDLSNAGA